VGGVFDTNWDRDIIGKFSLASGFNTTASGNNSTSMGSYTTASGDNSTSKGFNTIASGLSSTSMGGTTTASGISSTSMGSGTTASGVYSTSMGNGTTASGFSSTSMGVRTEARSYGSLAIGTLNDPGFPDPISTNSTDALFMIGNGFVNEFFEIIQRNAMVVLRNGNTGIGTSVPVTQLHIDSTNGGKLTLSGSNNGTPALLFRPWHPTNYYSYPAQASISSTDNGTFSADIRFSTKIPGAAANALAERMVITGSGNVGIGTNAPARLLHVNGAFRLEPLASTPSSASKGDVFFDNTTNTLKYYNGSIWVNMNESYWTLNGNNIYNNNSSGAGNVGIGTSTPNAPLQFGNNIANRKLVLFDAFNNDHQFYGFGINAGTLRYQTDAATSDHVFFSAINTTSSKELVRIKGNGKVGIGTSSPQFPLHVFSPGGVLFGNGAGNIGTMQFSTTSDVSPVSGRLSFGTDGTGWQFRIAKNTAGTVADLVTVGDNGNMGIGTTTPTQKLHVIGNILASGTITPSDLRYKKDIELIDHPLEKIEEIRGVTYKLKTDEYPESGFTDETQAGVIAQEVEAVLPQVVVTDKSGYKAVDYSKIVPLLIERIKELKKQSEEYKKENEDLKKRVSKLEKK